MSHSLLSDIMWHLDNRTSASHSLAAMIAWHFGYRLAERHVCSCQPYSEFQLAEWESEIANSFWFRLSDRPFRNGYHEPWAALGAEHVRDNRCNRTLLINHSYLTGWLGEVENRKTKCWNNVGLEEDIRLATTLYKHPELTLEVAEVQLRETKRI